MRERIIRKRLYEEEEILDFMGWLLHALRVLEDKGLHHSCLNPWNIIQSDNSFRRYKIIGVNSLYYYDNNDKRIYLTRKIEEREIPFIAPEVLINLNDTN